MVSINSDFKICSTHAASIQRHHLDEISYKVTFPKIILQIVSTKGLSGLITNDHFDLQYKYIFLDLTATGIFNTLKSVDVVLFPTLLVATQVIAPSSVFCVQENDKNPSLIVTLSSCVIIIIPDHNTKDYF